MEIIYNGAVLPLLLYGVPIWIKALDIKKNKEKYKRIQRILNIRMVGAFRTLSFEASCVMSGQVPIILKSKEAASIYYMMKGIVHMDETYDLPISTQKWFYPSAILKLDEITDETAINYIYRWK